MDWLTDPQMWLGLLTLTALEVVLGIDNIVFISILAGKLPAAQQPRARMVGLSLAMVTRIILLLSLSWVIGLTAPLFSVLGKAISGRDIVLILGGLFLLGKSTSEIHGTLEGAVAEGRPTTAAASFTSIIIQIGLLDMVFSLDSVITAVGMVDQIGVMIAAVMIAIGFMMFAAGPLGSFVERHPTIKMLALSFLLLIGMTLVAEGLGQHIAKGYIYFAMGFSVLVETLNFRLRKQPAHSTSTNAQIASVPAIKSAIIANH